jgi:hypothetical protein
MEEYMKDSGTTTINLEKVFKNLTTVLSIVETILNANHMALESMNGKMGKFMKENGTRD